MKHFFYNCLILFILIQPTYAKTISCEKVWQKYEDDWMIKCKKETIEFSPNEFLKITEEQCRRMLRLSIIQMKFTLLPDDIYQYLREAGDTKNFVKFLKDHRKGNTKEYSEKALDNMAYRITTTKNEYLLLKKEFDK
jgi:hypothetical protein